MKHRGPLVAAIAGLALLSCHRLPAPRLTYSLPPSALAPIGSCPICDASSRFASTFCSVYAEAAPGEKFDCRYYFHDASPKQMPAAPMVVGDPALKGYRIVLIGGFLSTCLSDPHLALFADADRHMLSHGVTLERVPLTGIQSVEEDAGQIIEYLRGTAETNLPIGQRRKILLVGHSKGAADAQAAIVALKEQPGAPFQVAALVTIAGMVGGSRLYDAIDNPAGLSALLSHIPLLSCPPGERNFHSLSRQERYRFLRDHAQTLAAVPSYAVTTVASPGDTSRVLRPLWDLLSVYSTDQDGQMAQVEQIPPGASYLGAARADHWAAAVPFETNPQYAKQIDRNHYPRTALLEAIVRFVVADLAAPRPACPPCSQ